MTRVNRTKLCDRILPDYTRGEEILNTTTHIIGGAFSVAALASSVGLSAKYLCRIFHRRTGMSPKEYLTDWRLRQADRLLRDPALPIGAVAGAVGYADPLAFSQIYRKYRGVSPSAARRRFLAPPDNGPSAIFSDFVKNQTDSFA